MRITRGKKVFISPINRSAIYFDLISLEPASIRRLRAAVEPRERERLANRGIIGKTDKKVSFLIAPSCDSWTLLVPRLFPLVGSYRSHWPIESEKFRCSFSHPIIFRKCKFTPRFQSNCVVIEKLSRRRAFSFKTNEHQSIGMTKTFVILMTKTFLSRSCVVSLFLFGTRYKFYFSMLHNVFYRRLSVARARDESILIRKLQGSLCACAGN